jgi:uncharacterized protein YceH (UPF0502 family)
MNEPAAETPSRQPIAPPLTAIEARVLGALMEKQLTTPDAYPLTLNSLVLACNQKTSREPMSNYSSGEVQHCVRELAARKLVHIDYGARAERYDQRLTRVISTIDKPAQALLNVMMLRGAQTVHELLTRTQRMHEFASDVAVEETLTRLCEAFTPLAQRSPRQAGQREDRFVHLLSGAPDLTAIAALRSEGKATEPATANAELEERVALLEKQVAGLQEKVAVWMGQAGTQPRGVF